MSTNKVTQNNKSRKAAWDDFQSNFLLLCQALEELKVSRMTLWRWIRSGKVPVYRIGREVLIEKRVVEELKARR